MSMTETHEGGCLCGAVRYRVHGKPAIGTVCHCTYCQRRLASAFAVIAYFDETAVELLHGKLHEYVHRSDESGRWLRTFFCPVCATTVFNTVEARPGMRGVAGGTFDDPDWFTIDRHVWTRSKRPWVAIPPGVATFAQGSIGAGGPGAGAPGAAGTTKS